ncbi:hypothetical protein COHA_000212 [Chlorella ohadii]|uniref:Uncharacterized protein n=1 Tax=Chlorella ohadii TaxID=2649997 RepID=A0AAD5E3A0_9CHLO|nr:hypothetical protein COHA_000212 [Chlorella ohadii]
MGEDGAVAPDNPSSDEQGRLEAARSLLERNGELVFKLNGLAALRRTAGHRQPSTEERALLAEAQRCLQDAASLLPPQALMPPAMTKRLRQQLETGAAAAAAEGERDSRKRRHVIRQLKEGQADERQAAMDGLLMDEALAGALGGRRKQDTEQLEGMLFASRAQLALEGQQVPSAGEAAPQQQQAQQAQQHVPPPPQQDQAAEGSSGAPPEGLLPLAAFGASSRPQLAGGLLSQAYLHGLRPQSSLGDLLGGGSARLSADVLGGGSARLSADLGLLPVSALGGGQSSAALGPALGPAQQAPQAPQALQAQPRLGGSALGGERLAGEDVYLLSKAYASMSTEQKERLAAQPPEVRQYVLRERMRRTKEQLQQLQTQQQASGSGGSAPAPGHQALGALQGGQWAGDAAQAAGQPGQQQEWPQGAAHSTSPTPAPGEQAGGGGQQQRPLAFAWQQQQQQQAQQAQQAQPRASPDMGFTADSQMLQQEQEQRALPLRLAALGQLAPGALAGLQQVGAQLPGGLGALFGASLGGSAAAGAAAPARGPDGGPFHSMDEEQRLEHLRSLKRRQEEWLEQQRLAAARLAQQGGG